MADVRSLLRTERASRRISHPQLTYSTAGNPICMVCNIQIKSESLWEGHLRSTQHAMRRQKQRETTGAQPVAEPAPIARHRVDIDQRKATEPSSGQGTTLKRKNDDSDEESRKRKKSQALPDGFFDQPAPTEISDQSTIKPDTGSTVFPTKTNTKEPFAPTDTAVESSGIVVVNEDEWAAFEADIAAAEAPVAESATISAAPVSAADMAPPPAEETSAQRKEREEAELKAEKDEETRRLVEELEEMENLEERAKRLRERREALRVKENTAAILKVGESGNNDGEQGIAEDGDEDDDESVDDDEWDGFRLRR